MAYRFEKLVELLLVVAVIIVIRGPNNRGCFFALGVGADRCGIGNDNVESKLTPSNVDENAENSFYLDTANPAVCNGTITRWKVCYYEPAVADDDDEDGTSSDSTSSDDEDGTSSDSTSSDDEDSTSSDSTSSDDEDSTSSDSTSSDDRRRKRSVRTRSRRMATRRRQFSARYAVYRLFTDSARPGKGNGNLEQYYSRVSPGSMFEATPSRPLNCYLKTLIIQ